MRDTSQGYPTVDGGPEVGTKGLKSEFEALEKNQKALKSELEALEMNQKTLKSELEVFLKRIRPRFLDKRSRAGTN